MQLTAEYELPCNNPPSPWLEKNSDASVIFEDPCSLKLINRREKIHRIRGVRNFPAEISHIVSPSEIWLRLPNHIADKLTISSNNAPNLETNLDVGVYVFTPVTEHLLVRARILIFDSNKQQALVRLIDHGKAVWRDVNAIFEMKTERDEMRRYPWQAIAVTLQGVVPVNKLEWSEEEVEALKAAFALFPKFYILPTGTDALYVNDDNDYIRVSIHGMSEDEMAYISRKKGKPEDMGMPIAELYRMFHKNTGCMKEPLKYCSDQKRYRYRNALLDTYDVEYQNFEIVPNPLTEPQKHRCEDVVQHVEDIPADTEDKIEEFEAEYSDEEVSAI